MSERATKLLLVAVAFLLVVNLLSGSLRSADAQSIGTMAKLPAHGACVGIIAEGSIVYRAFADGTVEGYRVGTGQPDWRPINAVPAPAERK